MTLLYIAIGGAIGAVLRYLMMGLVTHLAGPGFPYSTLLVNVIGSFLIGVLIVYSMKTLPHSLAFRAFLIVGLLGGFTTFSTFALDVVTLLEKGAVLQALSYVLGSVMLAVIAVFAGISLTKQVL